MMDKAYILENGILEQYLLGELNPTAEKTLEQLLITDDELRIKFKEIEANFEAMAMDNAINPPETIKENLFKTIRTTNVALHDRNTFKSYLAVAASIAAILFLGSIWIYSQWNLTKQQLQIVEEQNVELNRDIEGLDKNFKKVTTYLDILNSSDTKQYVLKGNLLSPQTRVVSYVNHPQQRVLINTSELPELDSKHDYQMWADVEGEMINMGVIKKDTTLLVMNYITNAESFNITIEPLGGSDHPTVSKLISNTYL